MSSTSFFFVHRGIVTIIRSSLNVVLFLSNFSGDLIQFIVCILMISSNSALLTGNNGIGQFGSPILIGTLVFSPTTAVSVHSSIFIFLFQILAPDIGKHIASGHNAWSTF